MPPKRLDWAREIQSIAQTGLSYAQNPYDVERYTQLRELAARMMAAVGKIATSWDRFFDMIV